jgi:hypothetical protein
VGGSATNPSRRVGTPEIWRRLQGTLAVIEPELGRQARVVTLGLHPHLIGAPHRFFYLEQMLDRLAGDPKAVFMTGVAMADWFQAVSPAPSATSSAAG